MYYADFFFLLYKYSTSVFLLHGSLFSCNHLSICITIAYIENIHYAVHQLLVYTAAYAALEMRVDASRNFKATNVLKQHCSAKKEMLT